MHKKSMETGAPAPAGKPQQSCQRAEEAEAEEERSEGRSSISKEELRENSIAALRAKAQEHSAKVLGTISHDDKPERREATEEEEERAGDAPRPAEEEEEERTP